MTDGKPLDIGHGPDGLVPHTLSKRGFGQLAGRVRQSDLVGRERFMQCYFLE